MIRFQQIPLLGSFILSTCVLMFKKKKISFAGCLYPSPNQSLLLDCNLNLNIGPTNVVFPDLCATMFISMLIAPVFKPTVLLCGHLLETHNRIFQNISFSGHLSCTHIQTNYFSWMFVLTKPAWRWISINKYLLECRSFPSSSVLLSYFSDVKNLLKCPAVSLRLCGALFLNGNIVGLSKSFII